MRLPRRRTLRLLGILWPPENRLKSGAILVLAGYMAVSLALNLGRACAWLVDGIRFARQSLVEARARTGGGEYTSAIEELRARIPVKEAYAMIDASRGEGQSNWVRYDLAPRPVVLLGDFKTARPALESMSQTPRWTVILAHPERPPRVVETAVFLGAVPKPEGLREDGQIPGWLDVPGNGEELRGRPLVVRGWCQEAGGRPCEARIWIDGEERPLLKRERYPRPDVQSAVPSIGPTDRAGFRIEFALADGEAGTHEIFTLLTTGDGRIRRVGPWTFRWRP